MEFLSPVVAVKTFSGSSPPLNVHLSVAVLLASHVNVCSAPGDTVAVSGSTVTSIALSFAGGGSFNVYTWWKGGGSQHIKCTHVLKIIIIVMQLMHENMCTQTRRNRVGYLRIALV